MDLPGVCAFSHSVFVKSPLSLGKINKYLLYSEVGLNHQGEAHDLKF